MPYINLSNHFISYQRNVESGAFDLLYKVCTLAFLVLSRGFCLPGDIADEVLEREGEEIGGGGAGGGKAGEDDVTEEFDEEDLDDALPEDSKAENNEKSER